MISDFPTKEDFFNSAEDYLNSSWGEVIELLAEFEEIQDIIDNSPHANEAQHYWKSAKQTLVNATALVQQAIEFYIKGRIVSVSPYLLITGSPTSWPKGCNRNDTPFSSFRTIDAQDLIKVHDTVYKEKFTDRFIQWNDALRVTRNKVIHTVDRNLEVKPEDLLDYILFSHSYFANNGNWFKSRKRYLNNTPANSIRYFREQGDHEAHITSDILREFKVSVDCLPPAKVLEYFAFKKKKRSHHCPSCYKTVSEIEGFYHEFIEDCGKSYQANESNELFQCCICNYSGTFSTNHCTEDNCEGLYVDKHTGQCISCGAKNSL